MKPWIWFVAGFLLALAVGAAVLFGPLRSAFSGLPGDPSPVATQALDATPAPGATPLQPTPAVGQPVAQVPLLWTRQTSATGGASQCSQLEIDEGAEVRFSLCDGPRLAYMTVEELETYDIYRNTYAPFVYTVSESEAGLGTATIHMEFAGEGALQATLTEQARIGAFARQLFDRLRGEEVRATMIADARLDLADREGYDIEAMQVITIEEALWPDSCLGLREAGKFCAQVATPGYRIVLSAEGESFEYRASQNGTLALATGHPANMTIPALTP